MSDHHASGLEVISRLTIRMGEHTALIPDIVLFTNPLPDNYLDPSSVVCAVEVVDETTRRLDTTIKPTVYASAGVPHFWLADPTPPHPQIRCYRLQNGSYELHTELIAGTVTSVAEPAEMEIDPAVMLSRAGRHS